MTGPVSKTEPRTLLEENLVRRKGDATKAAVDKNEPLFANLYLTKDEVYGEAERFNWLLVRRRTETAVYIELSLPSGLSNGLVDGWFERIIIGRIDYKPVINIGSDDATQDIDIQINRKQK